MNIFEKIDAKERDMITNYIESYAAYEDGYMSMRASLEHVLRFWVEAKQNLWRMFEGNLILSKNVAFSKPLIELEEDISEMLSCRDSGYEFYNAYYGWTRDCRDETCHGYMLRSLISTSTLALNRYDNESFSIDTPDGHKITVSTGCKVSKVLGKIASAFKIPGYEKFRIAHSMCLNQKKFTGDLCLSIHPLDYMTMSDNECDWESCMSWRNYGDYRQGTVEMMNSPYVVVAYLKSASNMELYNGEWNSKKWRALFIVTPEMIICNRQYPYANDELRGLALQWLRELANDTVGYGPYCDTAVTVSNYCDNVFANIDKKCHIELTTCMMYNDFSSNHLAYISANIPEKYSLSFSGESECMICGEIINDIDSTAYLVCFDCEEIYHCYECGERISGTGTIINGCRYCDYCAENIFTTCDICGDSHYESDATTVYLFNEKNEFCGYSIQVCSDCLDRDAFANKFGEIYKKKGHWAWEEQTYVSLKNLTLEGLECFDIWNQDEYEKYKTYICSRAKSNDEN